MGVVNEIALVVLAMLEAAELDIAELDIAELDTAALDTAALDTAAVDAMIIFLTYSLLYSRLYQQFSLNEIFLLFIPNPIFL